MPRLHSSSDADMTSGFASRVSSTIKDQANALSGLQSLTLEWYRSQSRAKQILLALGGFIAAIVGVLVLIFHRYVIGALVEVADYWNSLKYGRLILFTLIFFVGFPPLLGYSALSMLCGMVYGFPGGWPLLASATVTGSFASFLFFRYVLRSRAESLVQQNEKFRAFAEILKEDASLFLLILLRLCPLPYSLSNGALAAIPNLPALTYFLASLITSPKVFIHVFVGHTIKNLGNEERPTSAKIMDGISIIITGCALSLASYIIYNKMQQKLDSYHHVPNREGLDHMIFGNFDDDLESGPTVELDAADFDDDNFIIEDEDEDLHTQDMLGSTDDIKKQTTRDFEAPIRDDEDIDDLGRPSKAYRDY
ncbi:CIC11C00000005004 [Sungouiella intermedia]|uniref:Golgi apparatus membrane protein TVP38 n=1 Tax=Sungouiella intermedia TaxID=45354 RepID=A0A1L0BAQ2_9ASCO|nr:CIC11C00000005004 [[Candida] intermedia]